MKQKIIFVLSLLFGLMMVNSGLNKFLNYMPMPADLPEKMMTMINAFTQIGWLMPLVGLAEIVGGALFIFPKTRALGALVILPVMVGILLANFSAAPDGLPISLTMTAILALVIYENREKYLPLIAR